MAKNCWRPYRCVKCRLSHGPKECPTDIINQDSIPRKNPACVNCGALNHPVNFRGCPSYAALIQRKQTRIIEQQKQQEFPAKQQREQRELQDLQVNNYRREGISY